MSSRLEQFIRDNREAFDDQEPPKRVWDHIQEGTAPGRKELQPVIWLSPGQWSIAAAVSLLIAGSIWFFSRPGSERSRPAITTAANPPSGERSDRTVRSAGKNGNPSPATSGQPGLASAKAGEKDSSTAATASTTTAAPKNDHAATTEADNGPEADYREEMVYYAGLVRLKYKELRTIEKDEPLLYIQFSGDIKKLDSVYHALEKQLPQNPNHEQLLEAMIQDLQLQMRLLNHQLGIIKQINHSKKTVYENAYKTT